MDETEQVISSKKKRPNKLLENPLVEVIFLVDLISKFNH